MRNKIFLYLFIFMFLFTVFIYVNDKKILDAKEEQIENLQGRLSEADIENEVLSRKNAGLNYFSMNQNEAAISYFEDRGINAEELTRKVEDEIISRNRANEDNELVPFEGMEGVMRINKVKVLNHKWIIADFTDGKFWGELLISYEVDENKNLQLITEKSFLYPAD
ncbi:hypothetical protein [Gillisia limnaea]|uniref:Hydrolase n=1 Tax=Gillisia limnaea (strain DSM 15749 / LMG 21470 / R-8282) TaxID=865937 RepID=H2BWX5_GILLR|nr:hypothetical protein [Gillisia limnaea]EHQ04148.1 hypothetical protein Gilli_3551 [Gillisia limnaea DSM 15749]